MNVIYKLTSPSGKNYIGQTTRNINRRWNDHKGCAANLNKKNGCAKLNNAIRKYGWNNFTKEVIWECFEEDLDEYEQYFIIKYNSLSPNGYNLMSGGNSNKKMSDETKNKMKASAVARDSNLYRKKEISKDWPKYIVLKDGDVRIQKHPKCRSKGFSDKTKTVEQNLADAKEFIRKLDTGEIPEVIPRKCVRPKKITITININ